MTAAEVIAREYEHVRCRRRRARIKPVKSEQLILCGPTSWRDLAWAYDRDDFPAFSDEQIRAGLTVPVMEDK